MKKLLSFMLIFLFICGSFITAFTSASAGPLVGDFWSTKTPMNQARGGLGVVAVEGKIYAIGGKTVEEFVGTNEQYNPKTDTWDTLKAMTTPRAYFAVAACQGNPY